MEVPSVFLASQLFASFFHSREKYRSFYYLSVAFFLFSFFLLARSRNHFLVLTCTLHWTLMLMCRYFDYLFYVDFEASMADLRAQNALGHLQVSLNKDDSNGFRVSFTYCWRQLFHSR